MHPCLKIVLTCVREGKQRESVQYFMVSDHRWLTLYGKLLVGQNDRNKLVGCVHLIARDGRLELTDRHTLTLYTHQTNYCNPCWACAPRVNNDKVSSCFDPTNTKQSHKSLSRMYA